jgi:hypothetical protein
MLLTNLRLSHLTLLLPISLEFQERTKILIFGIIFGNLHLFFDDDFLPNIEGGGGQIPGFTP